MMHIGVADGQELSESRYIAFGRCGSSVRVMTMSIITGDGGSGEVDLPTQVGSQQGSVHRPAVSHVSRGRATPSRRLVARSSNLHCTALHLDKNDRRRSGQI